MMFKKPRTDAFVRAVEARLAPLVSTPPKDAVGKQRHARDFDTAMSDELGVGGPAVANETHTVAVDGHPDARLRVYWPTSVRPEPGTTALPVLVYFFGGGFEVGDIDWVSWDAIYRQRAADAEVIVVAGEYSLSPDVTYPAQPEQCWSVFEWAAEHAQELGGDPTRLAIGGASSGANLAAATALMNRDRGNRPVRLQMLEVPVLDLTGDHLDTHDLKVGAPGLLLKRLVRALGRKYLGGRRASLPYASPLLAPSLRSLPPTVIYTSETDPLRGDGEAYARALGEAGVPVTAMRLIGMTHSSIGVRHAVPAADHLHRDIVVTLRTLHDDAVTYPSPSTDGAS